MRRSASIESTATLTPGRFRDWLIRPWNAACSDDLGMKQPRSGSKWWAAALGVWCATTYAPATNEAPAAATDPSKHLQRLEALHHAQVWKPTNVRAMNLQAGPQGPLAFKPHETVTCDFVQRPRGSGSTPKFSCATASGEELKVRYGNTNGEVYAQVAATRLLWALGFWSNRMYPVKVACAGCPPNPFKDRHAAARSNITTFDPATIDVKADGDTVETKPDEGWSWDELDQVDEKAGGASRAQRDALTLLAVLMQHSSNKAINQRIVCLDPPGCSHTAMMISDVGKTFGRANALNNDHVAAVNFKEWSRQPIWKGSTGCVGDLPRSWSGTLRDPQVGEAVRKFLADLLVQLTDAQLHDLFDVSRFTERDPTATIDDWVNAFKQKRTEIVNRHCDS
jgi:hypothetical protein